MAPASHRPALALVGLLLAAGCTTPSPASPGASDASSAASAGSPTEDVAVVHKSATCACCKGHEEHLREHGFTVEHVVYDDADDLAAAKEALGVPEAQRSCHTTVIGEYVVEGHMPAEEIELLLAEQPDIDGIALPGMPAGSPGMPGAKTGEWTIWALTDGAAAVHAVR